VSLGGHTNFPARFINVEFADCPVETSLNSLGKKWAMLIIRDIGVYGIDRFNQLLKSLPGIPSKILATRLKQLEREGFLTRKVERAVPPQVVRWSLMDKGLDAARVGTTTVREWHCSQETSDQPVLSPVAAKHGKPLNGF